MRVPALKDEMELTEYEKNIIQAFKDVCERNKNEANPGASPSEVTLLMRERGQVAALDTVIDIERLMRKLRDQGDL